MLENQHFSRKAESFFHLVPVSPRAPMADSEMNPLPSFFLFKQTILRTELCFDFFFFRFQAKSGLLTVISLREK